MIKKSKFRTLLFGLILLAGCVATRSVIDLPTGRWESPTIVLTNIAGIEPGMTYGDVTSIMGSSIQVGYKSEGSSAGLHEEILIKNPYGDETIEKDGKIYRVLYYFTHIKKADGIIKDDELTPLVFENELLIGMGYNYLNKIKGSKR